MAFGSFSSKLTDDQYSLLGKILIEFSQIEFLLNSILTKLLITPQFLGRTYTDKLTANSVILAIENAIEIHERRYRYKLVSEKKCRELSSILSQIKGTKTIRNKFAHYVWFRQTDDKIFGSKMDGKIFDAAKRNKNSVSYTNNQLKSQFILAEGLTNKLMGIYEELPTFEEEMIFEIFNS